MYPNSHLHYSTSHLLCTIADRSNGTPLPLGCSGIEHRVACVGLRKKNRGNSLFLFLPSFTSRLHTIARFLYTACRVDESVPLPLSAVVLAVSKVLIAPTSTVTFER